MGVRRLGKNSWDDPQNALTTLIPNTSALDIGTTDFRWRNLFLSGTATIGDLTVDDITADAITGTTLGLTGLLSFTASGGGIAIETGGAAARAGIATLVAGTVTIATTSVVAASLILHSRKLTGGTAGDLSIANIVDGVSFDIVSDSALDTSTVSWMIVGNL